MSEPAVARADQRARIAAFDGLRGVAILLVVLGHTGTNLWDPSGGVYDVPYLRSLFGGGAVVVFFVVGGFIVTRSLARELESGTFDAVRFYARRLVRLGVQLGLVTVALLILQLADPQVRGSMQSMVQNLCHILTYTWNLVLGQGEVTPRVEVGHLWYLSVQQQAYLLLPFVVVLVGRRRWSGALVLMGLAGAVYLHRQEVFAEVGWVPASIGTTTRSDGLIWGVALALVLPRLPVARGWRPILALSALGVLAFQLVLQELEPFAYLGPWSLGYQGLVGLVLVAVWLLPSPTLTSRLLGIGPLAWLGRNSLTLFIWHLPIFVVIGRNLGSWPSWGRGVLAFVILLLLTVALERVVEEPTRRLIARSPALSPLRAAPDEGTDPSTAAARPGSTWTSSGPALLIAVAGAVLVVLGDMVPLVDLEELAWVSPLSGLFGATAAGFSLVLSGVGYAAAKALLALRTRGRAPVASSLAWFTLPIWLLQLVVVAVVAMVYLLDEGAGAPREGGGVWDNAGRVLTFTWNLWAADHLFLVRPELNTLTLFSLIVQLVVALGLVIAVLPTHKAPHLLAGLSAAGLAAVGVARATIVDTTNQVDLLLHPATRADAFLAGVLGASLGLVWKRRPYPLVSAGLLGLAGGVMGTEFLTAAEVIEWQLPWLALCAGVTLAGVKEGDRPRSGLLTSFSPDWARGWAAAAAWSGPVGLVVARQATGLDWVLRLVLALSVVWFLAAASMAVLRRPIAWLGRPASRTELSDHVEAVLRGALKRLVDRRDGEAVQETRAGRHRPGTRIP